MSEQRIKPIVIVPATSPLVHLAAVDALPILNGLGRVVVVDVVALEADPDKPFAREIATWIEARGTPGSNRRVEVAATELGPLYKLALERGVKPPRNAGEIAIAEWLGDELRNIGGPAPVVFGNGRVPAMLAREGVAATVAVATPRNVLGLFSRRSTISCRLRRVVSRHCISGPVAGEASSFIRCSIIVRMRLWRASRCELPKLSISWATFSQSTGALTRWRPASRRTLACSALHAAKSVS